MPEAPEPTNIEPYEPISVASLKRVLKRKNIRASTGHDRLSYGLFKWCEATHDVTIILLNRFRAANKYPRSFRYGNMVLALKPNKDSLDIKNFRPITLTTCLSKVYTTFLFEYASKHMLENKYLSGQQKAFIRGLSGCVEHHFLFDNLLKNLKGNRRLFLLMTDLKGAFDTVRHSLIDFAVDFYHFPAWFCDTVKDIYRDQYTRIKTDEEDIVIRIQIGVIQGDVLSVILFLIVLNLGLTCCNTPLTDAPQVQFQKLPTLSFADDVNGLSISQKGIEHFDATMMRFFDWTQCLVPEPSKYAVAAFERIKGTLMTRATKVSMSYQDSLRPQLAIKEEFKILGKRYRCDGDVNKLRHSCAEDLEKQLERIDVMPVNASIKLKMYQKGFVAFNRWWLQEQDLTPSFLESVIGPLVNKYLCKWSGLAACSNRSIFFLPFHKLGMNMPSPILQWELSQLSRANILHHSKDPSVQALWKIELTRLTRGARADGTEIRWSAAKAYKRLYDRCATSTNKSSFPIGKRICDMHRRTREKEAQTRRISLVKDGRYAREVDMNELDVPWLAALAGVHPLLYKFGINAITDNNPHASNRRRRAAGNSVIISDRCSLCRSGTQTLAHVLSFCPFALGSNSDDIRSRFLLRHNNVLSSLISLLSQHLSHEFSLLCDLPGHEFAYTTFPDRWALSEQKPDLLIHHSSTDTLWIAELTCPMEHNMQSKHELKSKKYENLCRIINVKTVHNMPFEIGALGGIGESLRRLMTSLGITTKEYKTIRDTLSKEALRSSKMIFDHRDRRDWPY